jgi:hypothetical protein
MWEKGTLLSGVKMCKNAIGVTLVQYSGLERIAYKFNIRMVFRKNTRDCIFMLIKNALHSGFEFAYDGDGFDDEKQGRWCGEKIEVKSPAVFFKLDRLIYRTWEWVAERNFVNVQLLFQWAIDKYMEYCNYFFEDMLNGGISFNKGHVDFDFGFFDHDHEIDRGIYFNGADKDYPYKVMIRGSRLIRHTRCMFNVIDDKVYKYAFLENIWSMWRYLRWCWPVDRVLHMISGKGDDLI